MADAVIFSDLMAHLVSRLNSLLTAQARTDVRVAIRADDSTSQVILRRDGGNAAGKTLMLSVIGVTVYESSYNRAETLALLVAALFDELPDGNPITVTSVQSSIQDVTDLSGERRFMRFAITHRGSTLAT
jgi:hypothetical protein